MNKKKKKEGAIIMIILTVLAFLVISSPEASRSGFGEDFNNWYEDNTSLVIIVGLGIVLMMVFWGFHEGKTEQRVRLKRAATREYEAYRKAGGRIQQ